jgi:hypothetical protein
MGMIAQIQGRMDPDSRPPGDAFHSTQTRSTGLHSHRERDGVACAKDGGPVNCISSESARAISLFGNLLSNIACCNPLSNNVPRMFLVCILMVNIFKALEVLCQCFRLPNIRGTMATGCWSIAASCRASCKPAV